MTNHTYRRYHPDTRRPVPRSAPSPPPPVCRLVHYDPRTLTRTEVPLRPVGHQCAYCAALIEPTAARRNELGDWACRDRSACWERVQDNERGGG